MNIIIFGATGGIGRHALKHALIKGHSVTAYVRSPEKMTISDKNLKVIKGEISDYPAMLTVLKGQDAVIWCVGIPMKNKLVKFESQKGHENLLQAMNETGVKRLIDWGTPSVSFEKERV